MLCCLASVLMSSSSTFRGSCSNRSPLVSHQLCRVLKTLCFQNLHHLSKQTLGYLKVAFRTSLLRLLYSELLLGLITGPFNLRFVELQEVESKLFKTAPSTASAVLLLLLLSLYAYANYSYKINRFETSILCFESLKAFNIYHFATTNSFPLFLLQYKA